MYSKYILIKFEFVFLYIMYIITGIFNYYIFFKLIIICYLIIVLFRIYKLKVRTTVVGI